MKYEHVYQYQGNVDCLIDHLVGRDGSGHLVTRTVCNEKISFEEYADWFLEHGRAPSEVLTCVTCRKEPEYHWMTLEPEDHFSDLMKSAVGNNLFGIVSVNIDGGIIAYAIGEEHAEQIVMALNKS